MAETSPAKRGLLLQLFATFFKIGAFTFGGGWAMISIMERELVDKRGWLAREDFLDLLAVAQSLPGILAVNISVAVGDSLRGRRGCLCAALGTILPSFLMILAIAIFLTPDLINNNPCCRLCSKEYALRWWPSLSRLCSHRPKQPNSTGKQR